ncbi:PREDICTED: FMRFamide receptor-like [Ceratosolen solmsi marchali]|uniref:FMRFamide receptor-like n=1 Tax=Ceratosolen solmsi marchali TaxID=326594 RepID=A0AAJ6YWX7_9HYME|nr:PREDICTED: FMRFamide receptor-like [Ceratosolen solmsi marchali]
MANATPGLNLSCGSGLDAFHTRYASIHGWASLLVCVFGSIANGLNIAVLTRREMSSPTNAILTGLAVADMLVMIEYMPYAVHSYLYHRPKRETYTYAWTVFVLFHSNFAQVFHTISIWLTVTLAVWRYIAVAHPQKNREWCSYKRTIVAIVAAYVVCPLICFPLYVTTQVTSKNVTLDANDRQINIGMDANNATLYYVALTESAQNGLKEMNFWMYSVVIKLLPCLALTILSLRLILALIEAKKRRKKLTSTTMLKVEESINLAESKKRRRKASRIMDNERQTDRTTKMLLAVLLLFLLTEFPQGTLGLLSVVLGPNFFNTCYVKLGEAMDILALINSAINFILYCAMSRQFRMTFNQLFCRSKLLNRWLPVPLHAENNNGNMMTNHTMTQVTQV